MVESWELGRVVRQWRDRVAPEEVGARVGPRRRATGLRREELAGLAGISVDYLTRLEQGRATSPSVQVTEALARALRLSDAERELLFRLAGHAVPAADVVPTRITPSVQRLLDRLSGNPVAVYDATWTLLIANAAYDALMGDTTVWAGMERNTLWRYFVGPGSRAISTERELADLEARLVADLRMTVARYPADPRPRRIARALAGASDRFARLWESGRLETGGDQSRHKVVDHPSVGRIALDCDTLIVARDDLRIMVYSAEPGTDDADRLALTLVIGTQRLGQTVVPPPLT